MFFVDSSVDDISVSLNLWFGGLLCVVWQNPFYRIEQGGNVGAKCLVVESNGVAPDKTMQSFRKIVSVGHNGTID
jgi:hypothetical protein